MDKTIKRKVVVSALLAIMLCVSLIAGATYALFTSESKVNVAVSSGKVSVVATAENLNYGSSLGSNVGETQCSIDGDTVKLVNIIPGDWVTFDIKVNNQSTVAVKYRTIIALESGDDELFSALKVKIGDVEEFDGITAVSEYAPLAVGSQEETVNVRIELPVDAEDCQDASCNLIYKVEAVQGNADTTQPANVVYIYSAHDLIAFAQSNGSARSGYAMRSMRSSGLTLEFLNDIDMSGKEWEALTYSNNITINGNGKSISNLSAPLMNTNSGTTEISGLTIKNSNIAAQEGQTSVGAFMNSASNDVTLNDCQLSNSTVSANGNTSVGGLIGSAEGGKLEANSCKVNDSELKSENNEGEWSVGSIVGKVESEGSIAVKDCESSNNQLQQGDKEPPKHTEFGSSDGEVEISKKDENNEQNPVVVKYVKASELAEIMTPVKGVISLEYDYVVSGAWTPLSLLDGNVYHPQYVGKIVIDGNGHSISGLTGALLKDNYCTELVVNELIIKDSVIDYAGGTGSGNGAIVGYMNGYPVTLNACGLNNVTVNGANNNLRVGGFIGQLDMAVLNIKDCYVIDSVVNGDSSAGGIIGQVLTNVGKSMLIENCKVENSKINSIDDGDWRVGAIVGTINGNGKLEVDGSVLSGNTISQKNLVAPDHDIYGRIVGDADIIIDSTVEVATLAELI